MAIGTAVEFMAFSDPDELASTTKSTQFIYLLPLIRTVCVKVPYEAQQAWARLRSETADATIKIERRL